MNPEIETSKESAKAIQEVAKTSGKAIDAGEKFGGFISRFISGPLSKVLEYSRTSSSTCGGKGNYALCNVLMSYCLDQSGPTKAIPLKVAIPLSQAASLEDDDFLLPNLSSRLGKLTWSLHACAQVLRYTENIIGCLDHALQGLPKRLPHWMLSSQECGLLSAYLSGAVTIQQNTCNQR